MKLLITISEVLLTQCIIKVHMKTAFSNQVTIPRGQIIHGFNSRQHYIQQYMANISTDITQYWSMEQNTMMRQNEWVITSHSILGCVITNPCPRMKSMRLHESLHNWITSCQYGHFARWLCIKPPYVAVWTKSSLTLVILNTFHGTYRCLRSKLWYLQHNCIGDTIVYH